MNSLKVGQLVLQGHQLREFDILLLCQVRSPPVSAMFASSDMCLQSPHLIFRRAFPATHPASRTGLTLWVRVELQRGVLAAPVPEVLDRLGAAVFQQGVFFLPRVFSRASRPLY